VAIWPLSLADKLARPWVVVVRTLAGILAHPWAPNGPDSGGQRVPSLGFWWAGLWRVDWPILRFWWAGFWRVDSPIPGFCMVGQTLAGRLAHPWVLVGRTLAGKLAHPWIVGARKWVYNVPASVRPYLS